MSIIQTQTTSFKKELYQGIHDLSTDSIYVALYKATVNLNQDTTVYSSTDEVSGTGYTAGGQILTGVSISSSGYIAYVNWANVTWNAALTARCALLYNASKGNKSVCVLDFGADKTSTSTFTITMPANTSTQALIRSSN
jgi:hypothetical protein